MSNYVVTIQAGRFKKNRRLAVISKDEFNKDKKFRAPREYNKSLTGKVESDFEYRLRILNGIAIGMQMLRTSEKVVDWSMEDDAIPSGPLHCGREYSGVLHSAEIQKIEKTSKSEDVESLFVYVVTYAGSGMLALPYAYVDEAKAKKNAECICHAVKIKKLEIVR